MFGHILQVNISPGGVPKHAIPSGFLTPEGVKGDRHNNPQVHGGSRQAVLIITAEGVDELVARGFPLFYGALGENLTTRGLDRRFLRAGQRYRAGAALLELTTPRAPCHNLDVYDPALGRELYDKQVRSGDPSTSRWALGGFYAAVIEPGLVRPGDPISLVSEVA